MKKILISLLFFTLTLSAFGEIPERLQSDNLTFGRGANAVDKELIFDVGDGASNPKLLIDETLKIFSFNKDLDSSGNNFTFGDETTADKFINFNIGGEDVGFKYDNASGEILQKKKVGDTYKKLGTGAGGGGGENFNNAFNEDQNADAEDGVLGWTETGGGTFTAPTNTPINGPLGEKSFSFSSSAQNDEVCSALLDFDQNILYQKSCEASIFYKGSDLNLDLLVVNGDSEILNPLFGSASSEGNNRSLKAQTIMEKHTVSFACPTAAEIGADADKGDIKLCVKNVGASTAPTIVWDKSYQGTLQGLVESVLPDISSAKISSAGAVNSSSVDFLQSCSNSAGNFSCTYNTGIYSVTPTVHVVTNVDDTDANNLTIRVESMTSSGFSGIVGYQAGADATFVKNSYAFDVIVTKQGADAKQSVQVYKSIPKVAENINSFTARINGTTNQPISQNTPWVEATCSNPAAGTYVCDHLSADIFGVEPSCTCNMDSAVANTVSCSTVGTANDFTIRTSVLDTLTDADFDIQCDKQEADFKTPTQQLVIVGQTVNSYAESSGKNARIESCTVNNSGTPTVSAESGLCEPWVLSLTDTAPGDSTVTTNANIFSKVPVCTCTTDSANVLCRTSVASSNAIRVYTYTATTAALVDADYSITCMGAR